MKSYQHLSHSEKKSFWSTHIDNWKSSDLTQSNYCLINNLKISTFQCWNNRLKKETQPETSLVPIKLESFKNNTAPLELVINHTLTLKINPDFEPAHLIKVLQTLGADL